MPSQKNENKTDHADRIHLQLNRSQKHHTENIQDLTTQQMILTTGRVTQKQQINSGAQQNKSGANTQMGKINGDVATELWKAAHLKKWRVVCLENVSKNSMHTQFCVLLHSEMCQSTTLNAISCCTPNVMF